MKPTHEEYLKALQTLKDYAPDKFLNIKPVKHNTAIKGGHYVIRHKGYFQIASSLTGEIVSNNTGLIIEDTIDKPFSAKAEFVLQYGEVTETDESETVLISKKEYLDITNPKGKKIVDEQAYFKLLDEVIEAKKTNEMYKTVRIAYAKKMNQNLIDRLRNIDTLYGK